jgi:hypothetical protein
VLCVGNLSRRGALLDSSQLKYKDNYCRSKLEQFMAKICYKLLMLTFIFLFFEIITMALRAYVNKSMSIFLNK